MAPSHGLPSCLLFFEDERPSAERLASASGLEARLIARHHFPDGELQLTLPVDLQGQLPQRAVLLRGLHQPNDKLVELLLAARTARSLGVQHLTLVTPYLAYMRQDIAFHPGQAISQRVVGDFLAGLFDAIITVDPHLHRVATLQEAVPAAQTVLLSGAPLLADWIVQQRTVGGSSGCAPWFGLRRLYQKALRRPASEHQSPFSASARPRSGVIRRHGQHRAYTHPSNKAIAGCWCPLCGRGSDPCPIRRRRFASATQRRR